MPRRAARVISPFLSVRILSDKPAPLTLGSAVTHTHLCSPSLSDVEGSGDVGGGQREENQGCRVVCYFTAKQSLRLNEFIPEGAGSHHILKTVRDGVQGAARKVLSRHHA